MVLKAVMTDYLLVVSSVVAVAIASSLVITASSYILTWLFEKLCHFAMVGRGPPRLERLKKKLVVESPHVVKVGSKLTSFINFKKICEM